MPSRRQEAPPEEAHEQESGEIAYYTCAMHPSVRSEVPGTCPICGMKLVPVTRQEVESGIITIETQRRQTIGVTTTPAERRPLKRRIRAVGRVAYDQTRLTDVTLKLRGWVGEVLADAPGMRVRRGDTLFTLYSPELFAAQEELLAALASQQAARGGAAPDRADYLVDAARRRLRLWDIGEASIERVVRSGRALEYVPIGAPASGFVIEKKLLAGAAVEPGVLLYRIAALDRVWLEAEIYESDLALVRVGDAARITTPYTPDDALSGHVALVYPYLDDESRTARVRIDLDNRDAALKPDMYADVVIEMDLGERLVVPEDAVLFAGERSYVFLDLGEGRLKPQGVLLGVRGEEWIEILDGLSAGDVVVTSGNFLVAAESRLKVDMEHWR